MPAFFVEIKVGHSRDSLRWWLGQFDDARKERNEEMERKVDCHTYTFEGIEMLNDNVVNSTAND